ncbi:MAG: ornithine cyclodeaminase family protein [Lachnospiraceae bacterium]|nr:ornithine cyclodeaminase family protein [Lachnospiraceae bacterium]
MNQTKLINNEDVKKALTPDLLIPLMRDVMKEVHTGEIESMPRIGSRMETKNIFALMGAVIPRLQICGCKNAIFPGPTTTTHQSVVSLFDTVTGELKALVSAEYITIVRTAATSAAITDVLARKESKVLCIMGAGNQGQNHARAIAKVRDLEEIRFFDVFEASAKKAAEMLAEELPGVKTVYSTNAEEMVRGADIICTVSRATEPILFGEWLKPGCHVNAVGACAPFIRELDLSVLKASKVYVDTYDCAKGSAGDLLIPIKNGEYSFDEVIGQVGAVINGEIPGRESEDEITLFETCGLSAQDIVAANEAWKVMEGTTFEF